MSRRSRPVPLSPCYQVEPNAHGVLLGYAATPERDIDPAVLRLAQALRQP